MSTNPPSPNMSPRQLTLLDIAAPDIAHIGTSCALTLIPLDNVDESPYKLRDEHDDDSMDFHNFVRSIAQHGVCQPPLLRPKPASSGRYEIVCGHRRIAALRLNGYHTVEALIKPLADDTALILQAVENVHRRTLTLAEEIRLVTLLLDKFDTQERVALTLQMSPGWVSKRRRLGEHPLVVVEIMAGRITIERGYDLVSHAATEVELVATLSKAVSARSTPRSTQQQSDGTTVPSSVPSARERRPATHTSVSAGKYIAVLPDTAGHAETAHRHKRSDPTDDYIDACDSHTARLFTEGHGRAHRQALLQALMADVEMLSSPASI